MTTIAQDVKVTISPTNPKMLGQSIKISKVFGEAATWTKEGASYITKIGQLTSGREKNFIFCIEIPPSQVQLADHEKIINMIDMAVTMVDHDGKNFNLATQMDITLLNQDEPYKEPEEDKDVVINFYRVLLSLKTDAAKQKADNGDLKGANMILEKLKNEIEGSKFKKESEMQVRLQDINLLQQAVKPQVYHSYGRN